MEKKFIADTIVGIDCGRNGGLAMYRAGYVKTVKMPKDIADLQPYFQNIKDISINPIIFLEKVQLRADDVKDNPGKAFRIQNMLMDFQRLKDYIEIVGIPYVLWHPASWQATLKLRKQGEEKKDRKNRYKRVAEYYYPNVKATLWNADAILIMHAGRVKLEYDPTWVKQNLPKREADKLF